MIVMTEVKTNQLSVPVGSAPNPDPTVRTMELVDKGLASLRNELTIRFDAVTTRFDANDEAIRIVKEDAVRVPTLLQTAIATVRELLMSADKIVEERLSGLIHTHMAEVSVLVSEREKRNDERAQAANTAVAAALSTVREATAEIRASFTKQIDQLAQIMQATNVGLGDKVEDLKERISKLETQMLTTDRGKDKSVAMIGTVIAAVVGFVVVMTGIVTVISFVIMRH